MEELFLELTHHKTENVLKDNIYEKSVHIDPIKIVTLTQMIDSEKEIYTTIFLEGPVVIDVKETPDEIASKIKKSMEKARQEQMQMQMEYYDEQHEGYEGE